MSRKDLKLRIKTQFLTLKNNAVAESFFKSLKTEWVNKHKYNYRSQAELSVFYWIETWNNKIRIHSSLGYKTINEFEKEMYNQNLAA
jgi:putative transposase